MTINFKAFIGFAVVVALICGAAYGGYRFARQPEPAATLVSQQQLADPQALQQILQLQQGQTDALQQAITVAQDAPPAVSAAVQATTVQAAAEKVVREVKDGTATYVLSVPGQQTLVVPKTDKQRVDVYRVTTEHARTGWDATILVGGGKRPELGVGPAWINRDNAARIGYTTEKRMYIGWTHGF